METFANIDEKITVTDLIEYIRLNSKYLKNIGTVNFINSENSTTIPEKKFTLFSGNINKILVDYIDNINLLTVKEYNDSGINISLFSSILSCVIDDYTKLDNKKQDDYLNNFFSYLRNNISTGRFSDYNYKHIKLTKKKLSELIYKCSSDNYVIKYLADYLYINIFIFDSNADKIYFSGEDFIPYKKNILLKKNTENFSPIIFNDKKFIQYNDDLLDLIINSYITEKLIKTELDTTNSISVTIEDLSKYIDISKYTIEVETINGFDEDIIYTEQINNINSLSESENDESENNESENDESENDESDEEIINVDSKMKVADIQKIAKKLNINIYKITNGKNKKKTKAGLINDIQKR